MALAETFFLPEVSPVLRRANTLRQRVRAAVFACPSSASPAPVADCPLRLVGSRPRELGRRAGLCRKTRSPVWAGGGGGPCDLLRLDEEEEAELARVGASLELPSEPGFPSQPGSPGAEALMKPARLFA